MTPLWRNTAISAIVHAVIIAGLLFVSVLSFHRRQNRFPDPMTVTMIELAPIAEQPAPAPPAPKPPAKAIPDPPKKPAPKPPAKKKQPAKPPDRKKITQRDLERLLQDAVSKTSSQATQAQTDDCEWYYKLVYQALHDAWQQPGMLSKSAGLTTTVLIRVQRDGTISQRSLLRSSGNRVMDQSVMEAVQSVTRLRPLPTAWGGLHKDISVVFLLTDPSM